MSRCHRCHSSPCNCHTPCDTGCGCLNPQKGNCVFYQGVNLTCLDVTKGDNYDEILVNLNDLVCDLVPPSGQTTIVASSCGNIIVTPSTTGIATTYNVCIAPAITNQITENTNDILALETCVADTVKDIVSDTITITTDSTNSCGNTLRLEIPSPSGLPVYDGIIYNDITKVGCVNGGTTQELKTFDWDYQTNNLIDTGDEIRFRATGQTSSVGELVDIVKIEVWDSLGVNLLYSDNFQLPGVVVSYSWIANASITKSSVAGEGLLNINFSPTPTLNGAIGQTTKGLLNVNADLSGVVWTNLKIKVLYVHNSITAPASTNFARQLMVEVRKKIV